MAINTGAYLSLTKSGMHLRTIIGGTIARFFVAMTTLAFLAMYTQSGYSYAQAGIGIGIVQLSNCLIAPQVSQLVDKRGQSKVVPIAAAIGIGALFIVLVIVRLDGPLWLAFAVSALIGFTPQVQSLTRARWSYLFQRDRSMDAGLLKTAFSFEGILDDLAFMFSPALAIALSSWLFPEAGLLLGGIAYLTGTAIVLSDHDSEPDTAFMAGVKRSSGAVNADTRRRFVLIDYPAIAVLFAGMFCMGMLFGFLDPATYGICREQATESVASLVFMISGIVSVMCGFFFGMLYLHAKPVTQVLAAGTGVFVLYLPAIFVVDIPLLFFATILGALCYAPFVITLNSVTERTVEPSRVTESLTLLNAGIQLGLAVGPILGGILMDTLGTHATFIAVAASGLLIPIIFLCCLPTLKKGLPKA